MYALATQYILSEESHIWHCGTLLMPLVVE